MGFYGRDRTFSDKVANQYAKQIPKDKVKSFENLFYCVKNKVGGYLKAQEKIGLSNGVLDRLHKGECTENTAKKILMAYNKICK